jgi:hypothetical protein
MRTQSDIKQFLINERGYSCDICKNSEWLGKQITLELHHVNGNPENNTRENLQILCPNCHSQTETYKGKNIGKFSTSERKMLRMYRLRLKCSESKNE